MTLPRPLAQFWTYLRAAFLKHLAEVIIGGLFILLAGLLPPIRTWLVTWLLALHSITIILRGIFWLLIVVALVAVIQGNVRRYMREKKAVRPEPWVSYTDDEVDGVRWIWKWGRVDPLEASVRASDTFANQLVPICPRCASNLDNIALHNTTGDLDHDTHLSRFVDTLGCPKCGFEKRLPPEGYLYHARDVAKEIIRRARIR